jgi:hypothetical protein
MPGTFSVDENGVSRPIVSTISLNTTQDRIDNSQSDADKLTGNNKAGLGVHKHEISRTNYPGLG